MSFYDAVIFLAAVMVIVFAGAVLGAVLRGRGQREAEAAASLYARKAELYTDLIEGLDGIAQADDRRKQWFIHRYYQALIYAPDVVVRELNRYLDAVTAGKDGDQVMELRGQAVRLMRADLQRGLRSRSRLNVQELYRIEVKPSQPVGAPDSGSGQKVDSKDRSKATSNR